MGNGTNNGGRPFKQANVEAIWAAYRRGDMVACPRDAQNLALSIDGQSKEYRLVCTHCGLASPWFASTPEGLVLRTPDPRDAAFSNDDRD
jgi:hypothetical protein